MKKLLGALCLAALACSLQACTSKGSTLVPLTVGQQKPPQVQKAGDNGGGPSSECPDSGCPDPTPTP